MSFFPKCFLGKAPASLRESRERDRDRQVTGGRPQHGSGDEAVSLGGALTRGRLPSLTHACAGGGALVATEGTVWNANAPPDGQRGSEQDVVLQRPGHPVDDQPPVVAQGGEQPGVG